MKNINYFTGNKKFGSVDMKTNELIKQIIFFDHDLQRLIKGLKTIIAQFVVGDKFNNIQIPLIFCP